jgi:hypothetical protein
METGDSKPLESLVWQVRQDAGPGRTSALAALLQLVESPPTRTASLEALVGLCQDSVVGPADLASHTQAVLNIWERIYRRIEPVQQETASIEWLLDDEYEEVRLEAGWLLDLLGYFPCEDVGRALREALKLTDPKLKLFAAISLLRRLEPITPEEIEPVAASHEVREILWGELKKLGMESLMPPRWATPEALAASALSRWLSHPNELNAPPEEIELMKTFTVDLEQEGTAYVYLFRYREFPKPWEPGGGWMAAVVGPYRDGRQVGSAWSSFKAWDSMSPDRHFESLYYRNRGAECE